VGPWIFLLLAGISAPWGHPCAAGAETQTPEQIRFAFAPRDGAKWMQIGEDERIKDFSGQAPTHVQLTHSEVELRYEAQEDGSWIVHKIPRRAEMEINGSAVNNPALDLTIGHQLKVVLDAEGRAQDAEGFREFLRIVERELDPAAYARYRQSTTLAGMVDAEIGQWNETLADLRDQSFEIGQVFVILSETEFQGSQVPITTVVRVEGWSEMEGHRGVKIVWTYDASGAVVDELTDPVAWTDDRRPSDREYPANNLQLRGDVTQVIEPQTGQPLYYRKEEVIELPLGQLGGPTARIETRTRYSYRPIDS
jgi:hypothetical protein